MNTEINDGKELKEKKSKKTLIIIIVICVMLLVIGGLSFAIWNKYFSDSGSNVVDKDKKDKTDTDEDETTDDDSSNDGDSEEEGWLTPEGENTITMYVCGNYPSMMKTDYCSDVLYTVKVKNANAKFIAAPNKDFSLYDDDGLKIYNNKTHKYYDLNMKNEYKNIRLNLSSKLDKVVGLILYDNNSKYSYYNIETGKVMYDGKYSSIGPINGNFIQASLDDGTVVVLETREESEVKRVTSEDEYESCITFTAVSTTKGDFIVQTEGCIGTDSTNIYTEDLKEIAMDVDSRYYHITDDGKLLIFGDNKTTNYDVKGKVVKTYEMVGEVQAIYADIYVTELDNKLWIYDYGNTYKVELTEMTGSKRFHWLISGYYGANELANENEKAPGYYFIIGNGYDDSGIESGVEYYFNPNTRELKSWELPEIGGYAKPVLYLYPEEETKVEVNFEHEENLTTTYPKFKDSWVVTAKPNGDLYDENGKYYYGLYWEENDNHRVNFDKGFYVTKDNAIDFLEEKLSIIGLNDRERNEFIMYWLPILEKNGQSLVYFELTEERDAYNKLLINPVPDSILRVAIHVKKVDRKVNIQEQELKSFERKGFTAVEWGGVLYN